MVHWNCADQVWSTIHGMVIDNGHLPIEILVRKRLGHRFVQRYEVIRFVEGRNDEANERPHVIVSPRWHVYSFAHNSKWSGFNSGRGVARSSLRYPLLRTPLGGTRSLQAMSVHQCDLQCRFATTPFSSPENTSRI